MTKVETEHHDFDVRISATEALTESVKNAMENLARLVSDEDNADNARQAWITAAEDRLRRLEEEVARLRSSQPRVSELEEQVNGLQDKLQRALSDHRSILQKLRAFEAEMQTRRDEMEKLAQRKGLSDTRVLMLRLDALELNRKENERRTEAMQLRIASLEKQCQTSDSRNSELQSRLDDLTVRRDFARPPTETPTQVLGASDAVDTQRLPESQVEIPTQVLESSNPAFAQIPDSQVLTQVLDASHSPHPQVPTSPFAHLNQG
jgi:chromosome segregation ATPase